MCAVTTPSGSPTLERAARLVAAEVRRRGGALDCSEDWIAEQLALGPETQRQRVARRILGTTRIGREQAAAFQAALELEGIRCTPSLAGARIVHLVLVERPAPRRRQRALQWLSARGRLAWRFVGVLAVLVGIWPLVNWLRDSTAPPADPPVLEHELNVVVAPLSGDASARGQLGRRAAKSVADQVRRSLATIRVDGAADLDSAVVALGPSFGINGASLADRVKAARRLAARTNADVVLYGSARDIGGFLRIDADAYISPDRLAGAEELAGEYRLGSVLAGRTELGLASEARRRLRTLAGPRAAGLGALLTGLQAFRARDLDGARRWLQAASTPAGWPSAQARALVALLLGNTLGKLGDLTGAERALRGALTLHPAWTRPQLGLAEVALHHALRGCGTNARVPALLAARNRFGALAQADPGLPELALRVRSALGVARADLCVATQRPGVLPRARTELLAVLRTVGARTVTFASEAAEAHAGLGFSALPGHGMPARDSMLLQARREYDEAARLTDDRQRQQFFAAMVRSIDRHLYRP